MLNPKGKNLIISVLLIVCVILVGGLIYSESGSKVEKSEEDVAGIMAPDEAANSALAYINANLLAGGVEADLIGDVVEEKGLYKFRIKIGDEEFPSYVTKDGKILFPQEGIDLTEEQNQEAEEPEGPTGATGGEETTTLGDFSVSGDEVCQEDGKPIVYFFGSTGCPHCTWEHPIIEDVAKEFEGYISFHNNMDTREDMEIFSRYSTGGVPTLVLGCKYYRVGSGERAGEEQETRNLTALICKLTGSQPAEVCQ